MLEVGRVEDAGGQHHHVGRVLAAGRHRLQRGAQHPAVLLHRLHGVVVEEPATGPGHGRPVLDHIRDAAGVAEVVLQHPVAATGVTHHVDAGDVAVRAVRHLDPHGVALEAAGRHHQPPRHDTVGDRRTLAGVQVRQEVVQGDNPLGEAPLQLVPFDRRDEPGEEIHGPDPLGALLLAVHGEGDPLAPELIGNKALEPLRLAGVELAEAFDDPAVDAASRAVGFEGLVESPSGLVVIEQPLARLRRRLSHEAQC